MSEETLETRMGKVEDSIGSILAALQLLTTKIEDRNARNDVVATISEALQKLALSKEDRDSKSNDGYTLKEDPTLEAAKTKAANKLADNTASSSKKEEAFQTAWRGVQDDSIGDCGQSGSVYDQINEQSIKVSTIGIPVDLIDYSNDDYEDSIRFSSEKQLDQILPEARPSVARIALSRYKVWRRKRGKYYTSN